METKQFYKERLQQVVSYIRNQYNQKNSIENLEANANFSYRNLQRIFKAHYNETIGAFVTRIKIENSAKLLLFTNDKIKSIADKVGYADVQTYTKAFKKHFGITPAAYKNKKESLFKPTIKAPEFMPFFEEKITVLPAQKVVYKTFKGDYYSNTLDEVWEALINEISPLAININTATTFGIIWDEPLISENITYNYDACVVIEDEMLIANKKFTVKTIPSQKYAVFTHIGSYSSIQKTYDKIFNNWLFTTNKELSEAPFLEFYIKNEAHTNNPNEYETAIYVPLKDC